MDSALLEDLPDLARIWSSSPPAGSGRDPAWRGHSPRGLPCTLGFFASATSQAAAKGRGDLPVCPCCRGHWPTARPLARADPDPGQRHVVSGGYRGPVCCTRSGFCLVASGRPSVSCGMGSRSRSPVSRHPCLRFRSRRLATAFLTHVLFGQSVCFGSERNPKRVKVHSERVPTLSLSLSKCSMETPCGYTDRSPDPESAFVDRDCDLSGVFRILGRPPHNNLR